MIEMGVTRGPWNVLGMQLGATTISRVHKLVNEGARGMYYLSAQDFKTRNEIINESETFYQKINTRFELTLVHHLPYLVHLKACVQRSKVNCVCVSLKHSENIMNM